jgi:hypothetical protein
MKEGALVPTGVTVGLLRGAMLRSGGARFLIDGFPRAVEQVRPWSGVNRGAACGLLSLRCAAHCAGLCMQSPWQTGASVHDGAGLPASVKGWCARGPGRQRCLSAT